MQDGSGMGNTKTKSAGSGLGNTKGGPLRALMRLIKKLLRVGKTPD